MKWYYNLKVSTKLIIAFIVVALLAGVVGAIGVLNLKHIDKAYSDLFDNSGKPLGNLAKAGVAMQRQRLNLRSMIDAKNSTDKANFAAKYKEYNKIMKSAFAKYEKTVDNEEEKNLYARIKEDIGKFDALSDKMITLSASGQDEQALALFNGEAAAIGQDLNDYYDKDIDYNVSTGNKQSENLSAQTARTEMTMEIMVFVAIILAIILGMFIARIIGRPVNNLMAAAEKLALGDVNVQVQAESTDEIGVLVQSFGKMVEGIREQALAAEKIAAGDLTVQVKIKSENDLLGQKLNQMVGSTNEVLSIINSAAEQVAAGSKQIAASGQALSQGSTEQASSIEEITASMTQVAAQTKQNALNANQANELATSVKTKATEGNSQMQEMVKAMIEINDASNNISKIIKVIDEIAFQTNILALNAAVEAARAGQHGKGFAVVAEEVRNLAARSANAAKETTDMIEGSVKKVEVGTKIANQTAEALETIVEGIAQAAALVGDIADASNEQATAISQVNQAINQVSQVVQTNSATAEESAASSEELSGQAEVLKQNVGKFKLNRTGYGLNSGEGLNQNVLRAIESMLDKKQQSYQADTGMGQQGASAGTKRKIILDDGDYGKY